MNLGLIARDDNSGLGMQTWEFFRHMPVDKTMVIEVGDSRGRSYPERYNHGEVMFVGGAPTFAEGKEFLKGLDIVFIAETPYSFQFLNLAHEMGVATIVQPNYELAPWVADHKLPRPDVFGAPTNWHFSDFPDPKILLPVPIATERFTFNESNSARRFLHVVGRPAANDRNGTRDLVNALEYITAQVTITIHSMQQPTGSDNYVESMLRGKRYGSNVRVVLERSTPDNYWETYPGHDVLVMPRRYGGLCLPVNEALGAGMPVIMPGISPNNMWLDRRWLTATELNFTFTPGRRGMPVEVYKTDPKVLAAKIDEFATDNKFYNNAAKEARALAAKYSWAELKGLYLSTFETIMKS